MDQEQKMQDLEIRLKKVENILYGISDDTRTVNVIRKAVVFGEHTAGKPTIINKTGKKYNLQTV